MRKLVGIIIADTNASYQKKFLEGLLSGLFENNVDAAVFAPFGNKDMSKIHLYGESEIYSLINYDMLDGIIIAPDTLTFLPDECEVFLDKLVENFKKPIVCADYTDSRFECIYTTDTVGMEKLTNHMIEEHNCKDILYVSGPLSHHHSMMRLDGFKNSLKNHNIEYKEENLFDGTFWYNTGEPFFYNMFLKRDKRPDAIICANEPMALGVIAMLEKNGIKIPDDIAVAGFDAGGDEIFNRGVLTSCIRDVYSTGIRAASKMCNILGSHRGECFWHDRTSLVIADTCGCAHKTNIGSRYIKKGIENVVDFYSVGSDFNFMQEDLVQRQSIEEYMYCVDSYIGGVKNFDRFTICLNENVFGDSIDFVHKSYTDSMVLIYDNDARTGKVSINSNEIFDRKCMYPFMYADRTKPAVFYFSPFHCYEHCFGYTVMEYINKPVVYHRDFKRWLRNLKVSFESLRRFVKCKKISDNNALLNEEMVKTQEQLILSFAEIIESKSGQTGRHVKRVSEYSRVLAEALGINSDETEIIRMAAMMHDIGKLAIPLEILEKPGKLTPEEFDVIKTHVTAGEKMLHNSPGTLMTAARRIALEHHEKWNGKGYLGKKGDEIDFASRIVAVADVYDALVSRRSYKEPFAERRAYEIIVGDSGEHFDPQIVDAFCRSYDKILEVLMENPDHE